MAIDKKNKILSNAENEMFHNHQGDHPDQGDPANTADEQKKPVWRRCLEWYKGMKDLDRSTFWSSLLLDPAFLIILVFGATGNSLNIVLTYLLVDPFIILWWVRSEKRRRELEAPLPSNYIELVRKKLAEVYDNEEE